jgi:hypothetical protein
MYHLLVTSGFVTLLQKYGTVDWRGDVLAMRRFIPARLRVWTYVAFAVLLSGALPATAQTDGKPPVAQAQPVPPDAAPAPKDATPTPSADQAPTAAQVAPPAATPSSPAVNPAAAPPVAPPQKPADQGTPATVVDGNEVDGILGKAARSPTGEDMGRIVDLIIDRSGQIRAAIIDFGGFLGVGSRKIAVDWRAVRFTGSKTDNLVLDLTRNQLRMAPAYVVGEPVVVIGPQQEAKPQPAAAAPQTTQAPDAQPIKAPADTPPAKAPGDAPPPAKAPDP